MRNIKAYHHASGDSCTSTLNVSYEVAVQEIVDFMIYIAPPEYPEAVTSEIYITDHDGEPLELMVSQHIIDRFLADIKSEPNEHRIPTELLIGLLLKHDLYIKVSDHENINRMRAIMVLRGAKVLD